MTRIPLAVFLASCGGDAPEDGSPDAAADAGDSGPGDSGPKDRIVGLAIRPADFLLRAGDAFPAAAIASWSSGREEDVTGRAGWSAEPAGIVAVAPGTVTGVATGDTTLSARLDDEGLQAAAPVRVRDAAALEARGVWVTRWSYGSEADVDRILAEAAAAGFNQVFFQVRGRADAFYPSDLEPWGAELTGSLGGDPGWDPLARAIERADALGLELHAWLNTFPAWSGATPPPETAPRHVYLEHPEWVQADADGTPMPLGIEGYVALSPGIPEVREHVAAVVEDVASRYAVDGIHLDYIRYAAPWYSHDAVSEARFAEASAADPGLSWEAWQRDQVSEMVRMASDAVRRARPVAALTAAVWFIRENEWGWSGVSQGYHDYYQDPWAWTAAGTIDAICPMIYFGIEDPPGSRLDFRAMLDAHVAGAARRHVWSGMAGNHDSFAEIAAQIEYTRTSGAFGSVIFAWTHVEDYGYADDFAAGPFSEPAEVPRFPWR